MPVSDLHYRVAAVALAAAAEHGFALGGGTRCWPTGSSPGPPPMSTCSPTRSTASGRPLMPCRPRCAARASRPCGRTRRRAERYVSL
jgi:hypothetical protein